MRRFRSSILLSLLMLVLCASIIVGSTLAYFTDEVSTTGNVIASGTLDASMFWADQLPSETNGVTWQDASDVTLFNNEYWEPNATVVKYIRIDNTGKLAFQYELNVLPTLVTEGGANLMDVIDVYFGKVDETTPAITRSNYATLLQPVGVMSDLLTNEHGTAYGILLPEGANGGELPADVTADEGSVTACVVLHMQETAGNEYQGLSAGEGFNLQLVATQYTYEKDAFGNQYDAGATLPDVAYSVQIAQPVTADENGLVAADVLFTSSNGVAATVPAGAKLADGVTQLVLVVHPKAASANVQLNENDVLSAYEVRVEGLAKDNTVPVLIKLGEVLAKGLNIGNYNLYHVENGATNPMTLVDELTATSAHNSFTYAPATGEVSVAMATFSEVAMVADTENAWNGEFDYSWYTNALTLTAEDATAEYIIANADQLAAFGAIVGGMDGQSQHSFKDETVKLISDINLGDKESENNPDLIFYPIGYYNSNKNYEKVSGGSVTSSVSSFEGTFDGNGHTIANFYQNTWEMFGDYNSGYANTPNHYNDAMGLFGYVYGGTIKNLTVDSFSSDGEFAPTGVIAAYADGKATFENIAITNCNPRVYNTGNGGIVGIGGNTDDDIDTDHDELTFTNITVDSSNKISALWGSWDVACGGLIGMYRGNADASGNATGDTVAFNNCHVSAQIDVYNDVCANYQYYAYRYAGMIIGSIRHNITKDDKVIPNMAGISATGCTVNYGDWNDYYYCEFEKNSLASYSEDYQFSRVPHSELNFTDSNGNGLVDADERISVKGCKHNHTDAEDKKAVYLPFHQLFTGYSWGVNSIGLEKYSGIVTNLDIIEGDQEESVEKFEGKVTELSNNKEYKLGDIFNFVDNGVALVPGALTVSITNLDENNPVSATFVRDDENWENGTLKLSGTGKIKISIQDYYFCKPTVVEVEIIDRVAADKFETKFTGDFLYRVGNQNAVSLDSLFTAKDGTTIGTVSVKVETVEGTSASGDYTPNATWTNGTIKFNGTGVVKVTITDDDYCTPTELYLEVIDATNITSATGTTTGGVMVLLCDVNTSSYVNYWNCTLYGNGFTYSLRGAPTAYNSKQGHGVLITKNATLDNLVIVGDVYNSYGAYTNQDYYNAAIDVLGDTIIQNCYISGCAAPVSTRANATITNTTLYGGTVANLIIKSGTVTLEDVTTANYDDGRSLVGMGIVVHSDATDSAKLVLNGELTQYNFISESKEPTDTYANNLHTTMFDNSCSQYHFGTSPNRYVNTGIVSMSADFGQENIVDNANTEYMGLAVKVNKEDGYVYTQPNTNGSVNNNYSMDDDVHVSTTQGPVAPKFEFDFSLKNYVAKTDGSNDFCYEENGIVHISMDEGDSFNWDTSILTVTKNGQSIDYTVSMNEVDYTGKSITFSSAGDYSVKYSYTDTHNYVLENGVIGMYETTYEKTVPIYVHTVKKVWKNAEIEVTNTAMSGIYVMSGDYDYSYKMKFLDCIKITDYDEANNAITVDLSTNIKSTSFVDKNGANPGKFDADSGTITITYKDGKILTVSIGAWSGSGPSTKTCSVKTDDGVYLITDGASNAANTGVTWKVTGYTYTGYNGALVTDNTTITFTWDTNSEGYNSKSECVTPDTLVTLADGTQVRVDSLTGAEELLVWNMETGTLDKAPILFVDSDPEAELEVVHLHFSDGTEVKVIYEHGFWDFDLNKYVYLDRNAAQYIGHTFFKQSAEGTQKVQLVDVQVETETTTAWSPVTTGHLCYFVNGMLSMPGGVGGLFNIFDVDPLTMTYDLEAMARDIETYGLFTYEELNSIVELPQAMFDAAGGAYLKVSIGKGNLTMDDLIYMIERYKPFF